jgi:hypothetical protein
MRRCIRQLRTALLAALAAMFLSTLLPAAEAGAQARGPLDTLEKGVAIGTALPHDLSVPDQEDQVRNFRALTRNRGLILIFSRSLSW